MDELGEQNECSCDGDGLETSHHVILPTQSLITGFLPEKTDGFDVAVEQHPSDTAIGLADLAGCVGIVVSLELAYTQRFALGAV